MLENVNALANWQTHPSVIKFVRNIIPLFQIMLWPGSQVSTTTSRVGEKDELTRLVCDGRHHRAVDRG